jgi:hypothetical protein
MKINDSQFVDYSKLSSVPFKNYKLLQLTKWLPQTKVNMEYLEKEQKRIASDKTRKAFLVVKKIKYALFVDQVA